MQLSAVILAAGQSRRMGGDKAWVRYHGKPLIEAALEKVQAVGIDEVYISCREDQDLSVFNRPLLMDTEFGLGPISGIERALRETNSTMVLVLPVDLPRMTSNCLRRLIRCCDRLTGSVAKLHGELEPLVAIYPKRCHAYAVMNISRGIYAAHAFAAACLRERAVRIFRVPGSDCACFANCNTPQDVSALHREAPQGRITASSKSRPFVESCRRKPGAGSRFHP